MGRPTIKCVVRSAAATAACLLAASPPAHSTLLESENVSLATRDKSAIARLACERPLATHDSFQAIRLLETKQVYVEVTCEPSGLINGLPSLKIAECDNTTGRWTCNNANAVRLRLAGKEVVLVYDPRIEFKTALEVAEYAATVRSFNGYDVAAYIGGRCYVSDGRSVPFEGAVNFNFGCENWSANITKDCGGKECRTFFTHFAVIIV